MLNPLSEIKFPDLISFDRQTSVDEIIYRIQQDPEWNELWDGELYQNATYMILQFFSFLYEKNAISANKTIKENFLNQAFSERAIYDNIKQMRINAKQNNESSVEVLAIINEGILTEPLIIPRFFQLPASDLNNQEIYFECIPKVDGEYNYLDSIIIEPGTFARDNFLITAYSGTTFSDETVITDEILENFKIELDYEDIIENSLQAYYRAPNGVMIKLRETDSLVVSPYVTAQASSYFRDGIPHYIIRYGEKGTAEIIFGSEDFGGAFDQSHINGAIVVYGRVGGGVSNDIVAGAINYTTEMELSANNTISVTFTNSEKAYGGADRETPTEVKEYGPLRYGRQGAIVDINDSKIRLQQLIVKHEIESPVFSEIDNTVPLLHAFHKIVPKRNFENFTFPTVLVTDTIDTYLPKLLLALNTFLNVQGTHDGVVTDEYVSAFSKLDPAVAVNGSIYDFVYELEKNNPLSGTLEASAWNYLDQLVDHITWSGNYVANDIVLSDISSDHGKATTTEFSTITIVSNKNDKIKLKLDNVDYTFELDLPTGLKTAEELAQSLQNRMVDEITTESIPNAAFFQYIAYDFFKYEETDSENSIGSIVISSPTTGKNSKVTIIDNGLNNVDPLTDLYTVWGLEEKVYYPEAETELVFSQENVFYPNSNQIKFLINSDFMDIEEEIEYSTEWDHDTSEEDGPIIELTLTEENEDILQRLQIGTDLEVRALDDLDTLLDVVQFKNVQDADDNPSSFPGSTHDIFEAGAIETYFDYENSKIYIKLIDGNQIDLYEQSFTSISKIMIRRTDASWDPIDSGEDWETEEWLEPDSDWSQDVFSSDGPDIVVDVGGQITSGFEHGNNYEVRIYKQTGGSPTLMMRVRYANVDIAGGVQFGQTSVVIEDENCLEVAATHYYDPATKKLTLVGLDPNLDTVSPPYYEQGFNDFDKLKIIYKRKSYDYITVDYNPNPYVPEGEAKEYLDLLTSPGERLIGLENIIKDINFLPISENITLYVNKNFSLSDATNDSEDVIYEYFGYDNNNYEHTIGTELTQDLIRSIINRELTTSGIINIVFNTPSYLEDLTDEEKEETYFFFPDPSFINQLETIESSNTNLEGITDLFKLSIRSIRRT